MLKMFFSSLARPRCQMLGRVLENLIDFLLLPEKMKTTGVVGGARDLMCQARDKLSFMRGCFMGRNLRKLEFGFGLMFLPFHI